MAERDLPPPTALVTGATGFLGSFLSATLLAKGRRVIAIARGDEPEDRVVEALIDASGQPDLIEAARDRLAVLSGDVRTPGFGLAEDILAEIEATVDEVWHCATSFQFLERQREEVSASNITGTRNVLDLGLRLNRKRQVPVMQVSTAYAADSRTGVGSEALAGESCPYSNLYEWSKREAERLALRYVARHGLPLTILRPSIIVGRSSDGRAARFTGYYDVIRAIYLLTKTLELNLGAGFDRNLHLRINALDAVHLNLVPVDFVVEAMLRLRRRSSHKGSIFHIVNERSTALPKLFERACQPLDVCGIRLCSQDDFEREPMTGLERVFSRKTRFQAPYLLEGPTFAATAFRRLVPMDELPCPTADDRLLERVNRFAYEQAFGHRRLAPSAKAQPSPRRSAPPQAGATIQ